MSKKNQEQPKSMAEALGSRLNEDENVPEPTIDETVMEAMLDDQTEKMIGEKPPQIPPHLQGPPPIQPASNEAGEKIEKKAEGVEMEETTNTPSHQDPVKPTIPASNNESRPADETSSPDSPEQTTPRRENRVGDGSMCDEAERITKEDIPTDSNLRSLQEFVHGDTFDVNWVRSRIAGLSQFPEVLPSPISWDVPSHIDIAELIYDSIIGKIDMEIDYVESCWPVLRVLMNKSIDNVEWTAGILCTLALFDVMRGLPQRNT
jgi:hypothetical protein